MSNAKDRMTNKLYLADNSNYDYSTLLSLRTDTITTKYIKNIISMNGSTAREYKARLNNFEEFVSKVYKVGIDDLITKFAVFTFQV